MTRNSHAPSTIGLLLAASLIPALGGCASENEAAPGGTPAAPQTPAEVMLDAGVDHVDKFLGHEQTIALRNILGGAHGVFIAPHVTSGAAIIGVETGTGFLLRRHGRVWSDPVFYKLSQESVGYQIGAKEEQVLVLIMTDQAMDNFEHGQMEIGGTGGFAIGTYGMGASGAGGIKGGLELILVSTDEGAFLGSGFATTKPKLANDLNAQVYGPHANTDAILAGTGGRYAPANRVRERLSKMVVEAWDIPTGQPVASR